MNADAKNFFAEEDVFPLTPYWYYSPTLRVPNPRLKPHIWHPPLHDLPWPNKSPVSHP